MDPKKLLDVLKKDPNVVLSVADVVITAAKKDPTVMVDLLDLIGGQKNAIDVVKAHPAVVFSLVTALLPALGADGLAKLLAAL